MFDRIIPIRNGTMTINKTECRRPMSPKIGFFFRNDKKKIIKVWSFTLIIISAIEPVKTLRQRFTVYFHRWSIFVLFVFVQKKKKKQNIRINVYSDL